MLVSDYGTLVIEAPGTDSFVQFSAVPGEVQMDFPLVTEAQKVREPQIRRFCDEHGLQIHANRGSDGSRFLDCALPRDAATSVHVVTQALRTVLAVEPQTTLTFHSAGLVLE
jgi:hypothetical protein